MANSGYVNWNEGYMPGLGNFNILKNYSLYYVFTIIIITFY